TLATCAVSAAAGLLVVHLVADHMEVLSFRNIAAAYLAAVTADLVSALCVEVVIRVSTGEPMNLRLRSTTALVFTLLNATVGVAAVFDWTEHNGGIWMPALMGIGLYLGYRIWMRERHRQERLGNLQAASHEIQGTLGTEDLEAGIVREVRRLFGARHVDLILPLQAGEEVRQVRIGPDDVAVARVHAERDLAPTWRQMLRGDRGVLVTVARADLDIGAEAASGTHSVMAAPVPVTERTRGLLALVDREAKVGAWPADEVPLLETLGNQIAVTLRNAQLLQNVEARAAENEYLARHDPLTGLPNRDWLRQLLDDALVAPDREPAAVFVVELTGFRELIETLGHDNADGVLRAVAKRLVAEAGPGALVGRLDGYGLAVVVPGPAAPDAVRAEAERLIGALHEPFPVDDLLLGLSLRVGVVVIGGEAVDARTLLRRGETAIRTAEADEEEVSEYDPVRDAGSPVRMSRVGELRRALDERELTVLYQPKVALASSRIVGAEALVRWLHPTRGTIPPDEFIPVAERSNVLRPMTLFVLELALARCEAWRAAGWAQSVAVNLSVRNLLDSRIVDDVDRLVRRSGVPAEALTLEITESAAMLDPGRARTVMAELRALGVRLAIDDFGAGYASLAYLKQLPANELKIDKAFIGALEHDARDRAIVKSSIDLAHDLGLKVVAEGVETQAAMDILTELGADLVQGWHLGRPMSAEAFDTALQGERFRGASVA
ncbi:MAG: putative bifunctional diguanylate cyclase/phosphodiesterase, partial [Chloroflexota bacterium]